jgi:hypothetical protein
MALVGGEVLQFLRAERLGGADWRLTGLLRGRGGTEGAASLGAPAGTALVLLDDVPAPLDVAVLGEAATIAAIGLADPEPVYADLANAGLSRTPLSPVHGAVRETGGGAVSCTWCRRSRGCWAWLDGVEVPLNEQAEAYVVGVGLTDTPALRWETAAPQLEIDSATWASIRTAHAGQPLWVRQVGTFALSPPLLLATIA